MGQLYLGIERCWFIWSLSSLECLMVDLSHADMLISDLSWTHGHMIPWPPKLLFLHSCHRSPVLVSHMLLRLEALLPPWDELGAEESRLVVKAWGGMMGVMASNVER